jgi:hypothetical protein
MNTKSLVNHDLDTQNTIEKQKRIQNPKWRLEKENKWRLQNSQMKNNS